MRRRAGLPRQGVHERSRLAMQVHVRENNVAEFERFHPKSVAVALAVLIQQSHAAPRAVALPV
jgi:hypothetical protein